MNGPIACLLALASCDGEPAAPPSEDVATPAAEEGGPGGLTRTVHAFYRSFDPGSTPPRGDLEVAVVVDYDRQSLHAFGVGRGARILDVEPASASGGPSVALPLGASPLVYRMGLAPDTPAVRSVRVVPVDGTADTPITPGAGMRSRTDYLPQIQEGRTAFVVLALEGADSILYPIVRGGPGMPNVAPGKIDRGDVARRVPSSRVTLEDLRRVQDWLRSDRGAAYPIPEARPAG
jgi:hypothetical protein